MRKTLIVTTKANDLSLLTSAEMRLAAGLEPDDASQDSVLSARGASVAASIMTDCDIAVGAGAEPTLMQETLTEQVYDFDAADLCLARRHNVEIVSLAVDDATWSPSDYILDAEAGIISRPGISARHRWRASVITVVYKAGFAAVPPELKQEALDRFTAITSESERDPYVKGETVDIVGVESRRVDYWAGALPGSAGATTSFNQSDALKRFRNLVLA